MTPASLDTFTIYPRPPAEHPGHHRTAQCHGRTEVDGEYRVPFRDADLVEGQEIGRGPRDAGVIDQDVHRAEVALDTFDEPSQVIIAPDVGRHRKSYAAGGDNPIAHSGQLLRATSRQRDASALLGQHDG